MTFCRWIQIEYLFTVLCTISGLFYEIEIYIYIYIDFATSISEQLGKLKNASWILSIAF